MSSTDICIFNTSRHQRALLKPLRPFFLSIPVPECPRSCCCQKRSKKPPPKNTTWERKTRGARRQQDGGLGVGGSGGREQSSLWFILLSSILLSPRLFYCFREQSASAAVQARTHSTVRPAGEMQMARCTTPPSPLPPPAPHTLPQLLHP